MPTTFVRPSVRVSLTTLQGTVFYFKHVFLFFLFKAISAASDNLYSRDFPTRCSSPIEKLLCRFFKVPLNA